jgi:hypothetical protein
MATGFAETEPRQSTEKLERLLGCPDPKSLYYLTF